MKLHSNIDVDITYQNFGTAWLGILRGATENIELVFNGLFNFCATNGDHQFQDHLQCVSLFWTDKRAMRRYFFNRYYLPRYIHKRDINNGRLVRNAMRYALGELKKLAETSHEFFLNFDKQYSIEPYGQGCVSAERPDNDMKDAILANAFVEKENKGVDND